MSRLPGYNKKSFSILDLSEEEIEERFRHRLEGLKNEIFAKGLPLTYQDERCSTPDFFIREYEDGRTFLAILDRDKLEFDSIRRLDN